MVDFILVLVELALKQLNMKNYADLPLPPPLVRPKPSDKDFWDVRVNWVCDPSNFVVSSRRGSTPVYIDARASLIR